MSNISTEQSTKNKDQKTKIKNHINHDFSKIKLIVGLGNRGEKFVKTRHNAGFLLLDQLATEPFQLEQKLHAEISNVTIDDQSVILAKPTTMMNNSGMAVRQIADYYKIWPKYVCVAFDDLDIKLGEYKLQFGRGPKVHNGISSVETYLNSKSFWRIRIGVDNRTPEVKRNMRGQDYVLSKLGLEDFDVLKSTNEDIIEHITQEFIKNVS